MISERTLRLWRKEALVYKQSLHTHPATLPPGMELNIDVIAMDEAMTRVLRLTQELLDIHLTRKA